MKYLLDTNACISYLNNPVSPIRSRISLIFGEVRAQLSRIGRPIGPYDLQIAAIALQHKLILVTHNVAEFSRVPTLSCEDWENE